MIQKHEQVLMINLLTCGHPPGGESAERQPVAVSSPPPRLPEQRPRGGAPPPVTGSLNQSEASIQVT